jgi:hypothetical protein
VVVGAVLLGRSNAKCHFAQSHCAELHYVGFPHTASCNSFDCHYAESHCAHAILVSLC